MPSFIRDPKDFWSGIIFIVFGLVAVIIGRDYPMGTAGRMGPAYFPSVLGALLALVGVVAVLRSTVRRGEAVGKFAYREVLLVLAATVLFGALLRGAGLAVAVVVLVMVSGYASARFKAGPFLAVAAVLAVFTVLVFIKGLGLPMPMFGPWLGF
ncbi:tripartite tricarboxylate transporter TctB family protein [Herbaspirillum sp. HC18]|nr:tripartite tricarboxylate transporter TctB family protein [Herbaspirillum sp. HC18]